MSERPVIFVRLQAGEDWIKHTLEAIAWNEKKTINQYVGDILREIAQNGAKTGTSRSDAPTRKMPKK